jgi:hypothetical protein
MQAPEKGDKKVEPGRKHEKGAPSTIGARAHREGNGANSLGEGRPGERRALGLAVRKEGIAATTVFPPTLDEHVDDRPA